MDTQDQLRLASNLLMEILQESGGALLNFFGEDEAGNPCFAIIAVKGTPETGEILDAVTAVEAGWEE